MSFTRRMFGILKWYCDQKNNSLFSLDFKSMLTKYQLTQVLSSDLKKTPVYFNWYLLVRHY